MKQFRCQIEFSFLGRGRNANEVAGSQGAMTSLPRASCRMLCMQRGLVGLKASRKVESTCQRTRIDFDLGYFVIPLVAN